MKATRPLEALLVRALAAGARAMSWQASLGLGAGVGVLAHALGIRRRVALENLAIAFPDRPLAEREAILARHYLELGRVAVEYTRLGELAHAPRERVFASFDGLDHMHEAAARGRGVLFVSGHFGNFELLAAAIGRLNPMDFVTKPLSNPSVDAWIRARRAEAGVGMIPLTGVRRVFEALRERRWVAFAADQDARGHGAFVPFFGRQTSTPVGPARVSLATGAPIVFGTCSRRPDGRHAAVVCPPLWPEGDAHDEGAVRALTARHAALLERAVRESPDSWFWLHRRWKSSPPARGTPTHAPA